MVHSLVAYGINHRTAPIEIRERLAFSAEGAASALKALHQSTSVNEVVLLSTCNRTEFYTSTESSPALKLWLQSYGASNDDITPYCYQYAEIEAVQHLLRVASGLDSMVLGEPQILGQMKQAFQLACETGTVGPKMRHLFPAVFSASKKIRTQTAIGKNPVSLAYAVVQLASRIFSDLKQCNVLLIGAGETIELVATHLYGKGVHNLTIANRTLEKASVLSEQFQAKAIRIGDIPEALAAADIVVTATASQLPILGKGLLESTLKRRKRRPMLMADLAVPRDIEPEVGEIEDVYLYNIDDLQLTIAQNLKDREEAAIQAEEMVKMQALHYVRQLRVLRASDMIRQYRNQAEQLRDQELEKACEYLLKKKDPQAALAYLARNLTNKMIHSPTVKLRDAAYQEDVDLLLFAKDLFEL